MDTKQYKYRVIWADDEIFDIVSDEDCKELLKDQIEIIDRVTTGKDLQDSVYRNIDILDAIIVDANFDANTKETSDRSISGLRRSFELYRDLNDRQKRGIPFYLYTNRSDKFLYERDEEDDYLSIKEIFVNTNRAFKKANGYGDLMTLLKQEVDANNTPLFQFRRTYSAEFAAAELVPGAQERLVEGLLFEFDDKAIYDDTTTYFTPIRMIWENIEDQCKQQKILPPISKLNSMANFLLGEKIEGYQMVKPIMPKTLAYSLKYFLDVTQDGSHYKRDLSLGVINYIHKTHNVNLYRTVLYIVMDLLLWYKDCVQDELNVNNWKAEYLLVDQVKLATIKDKDGKTKKRYYVGRYSLIPHKEQGQNIPINEGDLVAVTTDNNCRPNDPIFTGKDGIVVDKTLVNYIILERTTNLCTPNAQP